MRSLARYEPDLIIDTGDNLGHRDGLVGVRAALDVFRGVPGVFVHGSNDYVGPEFKNPFAYFAELGSSNREPRAHERLDTAALTGYFEDELGWFDLAGHARAIELKGTPLEFFGTRDAHKRLGPARRAARASSRTCARASSGRMTRSATPLSIGVTHAPYRRVLDALVTQGADLIFAGHTHGGQVRIPGQPALVTNCDIPRAQAQGLSVWHRGPRSAFLNVSAGIGTSIYAPVRFACPPEAIVLTLDARPALTVGIDGCRYRLSLTGCRRRGDGVWRSLVARVVRDDEAAGSNPVTPTE